MPKAKKNQKDLEIKNPYFISAGDGLIESFMRLAIGEDYIRASKQDRSFFKTDISGNYECDPQEIIEGVIDIAKLRIEYHNFGAYNDSNEKWHRLFLRGKNAAAELTLNYHSGWKTRGYDINCYAPDVNTIYDLHEFFAARTKEQEIVGDVRVVVSSQQGLEFKPMVGCGAPFQADNYSDEVVKRYNYLIQELTTARPNGRLTILDGPPGTGKSFIIRAIIDQLRKDFIAILPSHVVHNLADPGMVSLLIDTKENLNNRYRTAKPMILILEDADACLVPRKADNVSMISNLLNYTDGLFGSFLDIRIIATTNADINEIDSALRRPGRLSGIIEFGPLSVEQSNERLKTLGAEEETNKELTIAEIYAKANKAEISDAKLVVKKQKGKVGF